MNTKTSFLVFVISTTLATTFGFPQLPGFEEESIDVHLDNKTGITTTPRWVALVSASDALLRNPDPAGIENSVKLYLCRAQSSGGRYKPGKLYIHNGYAFCSFGDGGTENKRNSFQMLDVPKGGLSWLPGSGRAPPGTIVGGNHHGGKAAHVCRAWNGGALLVGNYHEDQNACYVTRAGGEHKVQTGIELLVLNEYGKNVQD